MEFTDTPVVRKGLRQRQLDAWEGQLAGILDSQHQSLMELLDGHGPASAVPGEQHAP